MRPKRYITWVLVLLVGLAIYFWINGSPFKGGAKDQGVADSTANGKLAQKVKKLEKEIAELPKEHIKQTGISNSITMAPQKPAPTRKVLYLKKDELSDEVESLDGYPKEHYNYQPKNYPVDFLLNGSGRTATIRQKELDGTFYEVNAQGKEKSLGTSSFYQAVVKTTRTLATFRFRFPTNDGSVVLVLPNY